MMAKDKKSKLHIKENPKMNISDERDVEMDIANIENQNIGTYIENLTLEVRRLDPETDSQERYEQVFDRVEQLASKHAFDKLELEEKISGIKGSISELYKKFEEKRKYDGRVRGEFSERLEKLGIAIKQTLKEKESLDEPVWEADVTLSGIISSLRAYEPGKSPGGDAEEIYSQALFLYKEGDFNLTLRDVESMDQYYKLVDAVGTAGRAMGDLVREKQEKGPLDRIPRKRKSDKKLTKFKNISNEPIIGDSIARSYGEYFPKTIKFQDHLFSVVQAIDTREPNDNLSYEKQLEVYRDLLEPLKVSKSLSVAMTEAFKEEWTKFPYESIKSDLKATIKEQKPGLFGRIKNVFKGD